jgi:hypothetical protein
MTYCQVILPALFLLVLDVLLILQSLSRLLSEKGVVYQTVDNFSDFG